MICEPYLFLGNKKIKKQNVIVIQDLDEEGEEEDEGDIDPTVRISPSHP